MLRPLPPLPTAGWVDTSNETDGDEYYDLPQKRQNISFQLELFGDYDDCVTYLTPMRQLVTTYRLPICVRAGSDRVASSLEDFTLKEGDLMILHFIVRRKRVFGSDSDGEEIVLPLYASQLYEILPKDGAHDDLVFKSTLDLANFKPLPPQVRVVSADTWLEGETGPNVGDIIRISHVEETDTPSFDRKKTIIGTCNGQSVALDGHVTSWYSTMVHTEPKTLCNIVNGNPLPLRIRRIDERSVISITDCKEELHVIATHLESGLVISIPVDSLFSVYLVDNSMQQLSNAMEPLYPLINWTMCVREMGRSTLPPSQQEIPQPMVEILDQWLDSEDGKVRVRETLQESYTQCVNPVEGPKVQPEYAEYNQGGIRKKNSIRDKIKKIKSIRRNSECEDLYASLGTVPESQVNANLQIQEMKQVLTSKEKECVHLKRENENLRMDAQTLKGEISRLQAANKDFVDKLYEMRRQIDNKAGLSCSKDVTPIRATSNEYVGMTSERNLRNLTSKLGEEDSEILANEMKELELSTASVDGVIKLLKELKMDVYCDHFKSEEINGALLLELDFDMLNEDLKMSRLHAKKLLIEVKRRTEGK